MERAKQATKSLDERAESYAEVQRTLKTTARITSKIKKVWQEGNKSNLIKIGMACIMFPDRSPLGEIIGAGFLCSWGCSEENPKTNSIHQRFKEKSGKHSKRA